MRLKQRWYNFVSASPWRGWMWVLIGHHGLSNFSTRLRHWRLGWRKCSCCGYTINIESETGWGCYSCEDDCGYILSCKKCVEITDELERRFKAAGIPWLYRNTEHFVQLVGDLKESGW